MRVWAESLRKIPRGIGLVKGNRDAGRRQQKFALHRCLPPQGPSSGWGGFAVGRKQRELDHGITLAARASRATMKNHHGRDGRTPGNGVGCPQPRWGGTGMPAFAKTGVVRRQHNLHAKVSITLHALGRRELFAIAIHPLGGNTEGNQQQGQKCRARIGRLRVPPDFLQVGRQCHVIPILPVCQSPPQTSPTCARATNAPN